MTLRGPTTLSFPTVGVFVTGAGYAQGEWVGAYTGEWKMETDLLKESG